MPLTKEVMAAKGYGPLAEYVSVAAAMGEAAVPALLAATTMGGSSVYLAVLAWAAIGGAQAQAALDAAGKAGNTIVSGLGRRLAEDPGRARVRASLAVGLQQTYLMANSMSGTMLVMSGLPVALEALDMTTSGKDRAILLFTIGAVGIIGDARATPALQKCLKDKDADVRRCAALALGLLGDPAAQPALSEALQDPAQAVQLATTQALSALR